MSEKTRLWPVMMVAAVMTFAVAAVMFTGAENEPAGPSVPENYQLRYSATVVYENRTITGNMTWDQTGNSGRLNGSWNEAGYSGPTVWEVFNGGWMIDEVRRNTTWGEKYLELRLGLGLGGEVPPVIVEYRGSQSHLLYMKEIVAPGYRATFMLTGTNFTEIIDMDKESSGNGPFQGYSDYHPDHRLRMDLDGSYHTSMVKVETGHDWYRMNATNYAFLYIGQEDARSMIDGGDYRYDEQRSLFGNGTLHFRATGEWFIRQVWPVGDGPHQLTMDTALTEEE